MPSGADQCQKETKHLSTNRLKQYHALNWFLCHDLYLIEIKDARISNGIN